MESPRVDLFKNTSEDSPSSLLPWWKKHDKVCFVWRLHVWENMMKCPWGDVSAEQQEKQTCTLQCPPHAGVTPASDGQEYSQPVVQTTWSWCAIILQTAVKSQGLSDHFLQHFFHTLHTEQHFSLICRNEEETSFLKLASLLNLVAMVELQNKSTLTWMQNISAARQWWAQLPPPDWRLIQLFLPLNWGLLGHAPSPRE